MSDRNPHPWDIEKHGAYVFNFSPSKDDFSRVRIGNGWRLSKEHALKGNEAAVVYAHRDDMRPEDAWLFSIGFLFRKKGAYVASVTSRVDIPRDKWDDYEREDDPIHRLTLRLGTGQTAGMQNQLINCWSLASQRPEVFNVGFRVPKTGTYFFSIEAHSDLGAPGAIVVVANSVGSVA